MPHAPGPFTPGSVDWGSRPSRASGTHYPINKIAPGKTHDFRVLCPAVYEITIHYDGDRNLPCTDKTGLSCWFQHDKGKTKQQFWFQCWNRQAKRVEIVPLTENAWKMVEKVAAKVADLRGARLELWRQGLGLRCPMAAHLTLNPDLCDVHLPPPCDIHAQLCAVWNAPLRDPQRQEAREMRYAADVLPRVEANGLPFADDNP